MIQVILSAIGVYIATSLDYLVVLTILFAEMPHKKWHMYVGQYIGTALLVLIGLFATYTTYLVPQDWMIGLWGLAPIYLGVRFFLVRKMSQKMILWNDSAKRHQRHYIGKWLFSLSLLEEIILGFIFLIFPLSIKQKSS